MHGMKTGLVALTLCSSIDSIHWSLCSGSSALRYHRLSFTLMSKRHSSNSWGCTEGREERTRVRALLDRAPQHKLFLWGETNTGAWRLRVEPWWSALFPPGPDGASVSIIPLSFRHFFWPLHFHPTRVDLNVDNKPFLLPPRSEFRRKKNPKRQHECFEKQRESVNVKCWAMSSDMSLRRRHARWHSRVFIGSVHVNTSTDRPPCLPQAVWLSRCPTGCC